MHILVVEDDDSIRGILVRGLTEEGFAVSEAANGEDAASLALDPVFDLIILDLILPKRDGLVVLRELRANAMTTPVLVLTAPMHYLIEFEVLTTALMTIW